MVAFSDVQPSRDRGRPRSGAARTRRAARTCRRRPPRARPSAGAGRCSPAGPRPCRPGSRRCGRAGRRGPRPGFRGEQVRGVRPRPGRRQDGRDEPRVRVGERGAGGGAGVAEHRVLPAARGQRQPRGRLGRGRHREPHLARVSASRFALITGSSVRRAAAIRRLLESLSVPGAPCAVDCPHVTSSENRRDRARGRRRRWRHRRPRPPPASRATAAPASSTPRSRPTCAPPTRGTRAASTHCCTATSSGCCPAARCSAASGDGRVHRRLLRPHGLDAELRPRRRTADCETGYVLYESVYAEPAAGY